MASIPAIDFKNLDDDAGYTICDLAIKNPETRNFVVEFGDQEARCAVGVSAAQIFTLLNDTRSDQHPARWFNFYGGDLSRDEINALVTHYKLSPRLLGLLCSEASAEFTKFHPHGDKSEDEVDEKNPGTKSTRRPDAEIALDVLKKSLKQKLKPRALDLHEFEFGKVVDDIMHFVSVDVGDRYLCVGYNSLHTIPGVLIESGPDKPYGKRIFNTLVLCDDGTVISTSEKPFPPGQKLDEKVLRVARRQTAIVFRHLSKSGTARAAAKGRSNPLDRVTIRNFEDSVDGHSSETEFATRPSPLQHASLLFYYLFDDWSSHYSLVARQEHPYGQILEQIRAQMFLKADVELIQTLHHVGRQISLLKRIYLSLQSITKRIIDRQQSLQQDPSRLRSGSTAFNLTRANTSLGENPLLAVEERSPGVILSASAIARFERLLDRISLYALSEIDEFLAEKEALVQMSFNLISLKESQAVERLTRNTVAISKIAAFFLPLSLMTAYFSTSIPQLQRAYGAQTYWFSFLVVVVLTIIGMAVFERAADRVQGRTNFRSFTSIVLGKAHDKRKRKDISPG